MTSSLSKTAAAGIVALLLLVTLVGAPHIGYAAFPGVNGKIAFISNRDGNAEIYVMEPDGSNQTNLTNNGHHLEPANGGRSGSLQRSFPAPRRAARPQDDLLLPR